MWPSFALQKRVSALTVYKDDLCLFPAGDCFCQSEDLHSTGAKIRNWLPGDHHCSVSQQCGRVCFCQTSNQWVKSQGCISQQREIYQDDNTICLMFSCIHSYTCDVFFFSSYRVFARGVQSTSGPSRLLLSLCGLGSAFISRAGLQTHLWTTRSGTRIPLFRFPVYLYLSSSFCLPPV